MSKKFIFFILLVGAGGWIYATLRPEPLPIEEAAKLDITETSFQGKVLSREGNVFVVEASRVERSEAGNQAVIYQQQVSLTKELSTSSVLKVGDTAVFYGLGTSVGQAVFTATRVDVLARATTSTPKLPAGAPPLD